MAPLEAADFIMERRKMNFMRFGVWEESDEQLELEMIQKTNLLEVLQARGEQTLRLVPVVSGG